MPKTLEQMWKLGDDAVWNPSAWERFTHWGKVRAITKPQNAGKIAVKIGTKFLSIVPFLGMAIDVTVAKAIDELRNSRNRSKLNAYRGNLEKEVKYGIKLLNLETLDRSRAKVHEAAVEVNKALAMEHFYDHPCQSIFALTKSFGYLYKRADILESQAKIMKQVAEDTLKWCEQVLGEAKSALDQLDPGLKHDVELAEFKNPHHHHSCDAALCMVK